MVSAANVDNTCSHAQIECLEISLVLLANLAHCSSFRTLGRHHFLAGQEGTICPLILRDRMNTLGVEAMFSWLFLMELLLASKLGRNHYESDMRIM